VLSFTGEGKPWGRPAPPVVIQAPSSPPLWYYCDNPGGYEPYVTQCPGGWRTVAPPPIAAARTGHRLDKVTLRGGDSGPRSTRAPGARAPCPLVPP
jgi:hypothetical protein